MIPLKLLVVSLIGWGGDLDNVVLDFTSTRCGPCQQMSPIVSQLERRGFPIHRVDMDSDSSLARKYNVRSMPTFIVVVDGVEQKRVSGVISEDRLKQLCASIPDSQNSATAVAASPTANRKSLPGVESSLGSPGQLPQADKPSPPKSGIKWPFSADRKEESSRRDSGEGALSRGNGDPATTFLPPVQGNPLAASVRIRMKDSKGDQDVGSGTIIDSRIGKTTILTCGHIFRSWDKWSVIEVDYFHEGKSQTVIGSRVYHNLQDDVALISVNVDPLLPHCQVAPPGTKILVGMPVITVGCSGGEKPTVQQLKISALNRYLGGDNIEVGGMPAQGRSGGGLFTKDGQVIGVCSGADSHYREGLYGGLKLVHDLLDHCRLTHLYRSSGAPDDVGQGAVDLADESVESEPANADPSTRANLAQGKPLRKKTETQKMASQGHLRVAEATPVESTEEKEIREAMNQAGEAEIVCIIRPINQPRAASRVVILNRASRRFVEYLSEETDSPQDLQATTLTTKSAKSAKPVVDQKVKRPLTNTPAPNRSPAGRDGASAEPDGEPALPAGPQPYRRKRSSPPLASRTSSR